MNCTDAFPYVLKKKIDKTAEGRGGNGIFKRRNTRAYRVIIQLSTYKKIVDNDPNFLNNFSADFQCSIKS